MLHRRLSSGIVQNADIPETKHGPNAYEMISEENSQSESSAPGPPLYTSAIKPLNNGGTQPSAPPSRSSHQDVTLVDNDLYQ